MNDLAFHPRRTDTLDFISLCTGGGGLDLGLELACPNARPVLLVEREAIAVSHLVEAMREGLLAAAPVWSDARTFDGRAFRGCVDGLIGGIPCQPHSLAGKRLGEDDERDLWSTARRIIVQSGAWFVLIENVGGMLSSGGAERVWRDLRRLGFAVEGGLFTAAEVGASHQRERLFILGILDHPKGRRERRITGNLSGKAHEDDAGRQAWRDRHPHPAIESMAGVGQADANEPRSPIDLRQPGEPRQELEAVERSGWPLVDAESFGRGEGRPEPEFRSGRDSAAGPDRAVADTTGREQRRARQRRPSAGSDELPAGRHGGIPLFPPGPGDADVWRSVLARAPNLEPAVRRMADGMASRVDRLRMLGNGVVPLEAAYAIRTLATRLASSGSAGATRIVRMMGTEK